MSTSRLFWKLVLTCAGINLAAAVVTGLILSSQLGEEAIEAAAAHRWIWAAVTVESISAFALAYWLIGRMVRPILALNSAASAIAAGDYDRRAYVPGRDELGTLAGTLNRISESLGHRMTQLTDTAAHQSTVLSGMLEGVIAVDARERVVLANIAAGRLYGFRPAEVEGRPLLEVIRNHALHAAVAHVLESGESQRIDSPSSTSQKFHADIHVQPLPGKPCPGVVLVIHDTTELERLEAIRRDFVANVSHELKTPLSSIKAYTETLQNGTDAETTTRFLARIEEQTDRLHRLIIDMLMLARIESDDQAFEIVPVDVGEVVRNCMEGQRRAADAKRITLIAQPNGNIADVPPQVRADREGFREILDNLVDNAIKYTPEGGSVTISWRNEARGARSEERGARSEARGTSAEKSSSNIQRPASNIEHPTSNIQFASTPNPQSPAPSLLLTITDTGIGIKPQDQERIFERFYRVDKARSRELGGTGLGLAIVKHLTQAFGGRVTVHSTPSQGSTFTVELPLA